jgi:putative ABC transport system permease protein
MLVVRDLWRNRGRTALAILSIAVGIIAVGAIATSSAVFMRAMDQEYQAIQPADVIMWTSALDEDAIAAIGRLPQVEAAEGKMSFRVQVQVGPDEWKPVDLYVAEAPDKVRIAKVWAESGELPPANREIVLERLTLPYLGAQQGDTLTVRAFEGLERELIVSGTAHNINLPPAQWSDAGSAYISEGTLEWFGMLPLHTQVYVRVPAADRNQAQITEAAKAVTERIEKGGGNVWGYWVLPAGEHWANDILVPVMLIMQVLGLLALGLSGFLVINTVTAILAQQRRIIGMLKSLGARRLQVTVLYLAMVLVFAVLALAVALPIKTVMARGIADYLANMLNIDIVDYRPPLHVVMIEASVGLLAPLLTALGPVIKGAGLTVREAVTDYGISGVSTGDSRLQKALLGVRGLSRTFTLSLRNTFRKRGRLILTLSTLVMGGAVFISVMSVQASLGRTTDEALQYWNHELTLNLERPLRVEKIETELMAVPGVKAVESWLMAGTERVLDDDSHGRAFTLIAPPAGTTMIVPTMVTGRWLLPEDENALVVNTDVLKNDPTIMVGQTITLQLDRNGNKIETEWVVVGVVKALMVGPLGYANYPYVSDVLATVGRASSVRIQLEDGSPAGQQAMGKALESYLKARGITVNSWETTDMIRQRILSQLMTVVAILLTMSVLFAAVGGLGLMGTMSINVLERRREVGVMRAIGASSRVVRRVILTESMIIALLSWVIGGLLAVPLSALLGQALGAAMIRSPLSRVFSMPGLVIWLAIVLGIGALASILPAQRAARVAVRDVLAYD